MLIKLCFVIDKSLIFHCVYSYDVFNIFNLSTVLRTWKIMIAKKSYIIIIPLGQTLEYHSVQQPFYVS